MLHMIDVDPCCCAKAAYQHMGCNQPLSALVWMLKGLWEARQKLSFCSKKTFIAKSNHFKWSFFVSGACRRRLGERPWVSSKKYTWLKRPNPKRCVWTHDKLLLACQVSADIKWCGFFIRITSSHVSHSFSLGIIVFFGVLSTHLVLGAVERWELNRQKTKGVEVSTQKGHFVVWNTHPSSDNKVYDIYLMALST